MPLFKKKDRSVAEVEEAPIEEFNADEDLDVILTRAVERYERITGRSLAPAASRSFDDITREIMGKLEREKAVTNSKAVSVITNIGTCLGKFGGLLAATASVTFPGSSQAWNAIGLIMDTATQYKAIFDGFITLMERTVAFMENLNIYLEKHRSGGQILDPALRKKTYGILSNMFDMLAESHRLTKSKSKQFKAAVGVFLFSSDQGVKDSLCAFEVSMRELTGMQVTTILANVENLAIEMMTYHQELVDLNQATLENTKDLKSSVERIGAANEHLIGATGRIEANTEETKQRTNEIMAATERIEAVTTKQTLDRSTKETLNTIAKALDLANDLSSGTPPWVDRQHRLRLTRTPGTGKWLYEMHEYKHWSHVEEWDTKLMAVLGEAGYGKSHICSLVVDDLLNTFAKGSAGAARQERVATAYFYFSRGPLDSPGAKRDASKETVTSMLATIIYQWAQANSEYAKAVAAACSKTPDLSKAATMWKNLVTNIIDTSMGTFFAVIDGYEKGDEDEEDDKTALQTLSNLLESCMKERSPIRIVISGPEADMRDLLPERTPQGSKIRLGVVQAPIGKMIRRSSRLALEAQSDEGSSTPNEADLLAYATARIDEMVKKDSDLARILQDPTLDAAKKLAHGVRGDYNSLKAKLSEILTSDGEDEDLRDIINRADESKEQSLRRIIDDMHAKLKPSEVEELNSILPWVFAVKGGECSLALLQNVLMFASKKGRGLQAHIKSRFKPLLRINKAKNIEQWDPDLRKMLQEITSADNIVQSTETKLVLKGEINVMSKVIQNFCGSELYQKFDFDGFFAGKLEGTPIYVNPGTEDENNLRISQICMDVLANRMEDEHLEALQKYSASWVHYHLDFIDPEKAEASDKENIAKWLVTVFYDSKAINDWWKNYLVAWLNWDYIYQDDDRFTNAVVKWLKAAPDSLIKSYPADQQKWLQDVRGDKPILLLDRILQHMVRRWFSSIRLASAVFDAAYGLYVHVNDIKEELPFNFNWIPTLAKLDAFITWVKNNVQLNVSEAQFKFRTGAAYKYKGFNKEALEQMQSARKDGLEDWSLILSTAQSHVALEEYKLGLECAHQVRKRKDEIAADKENKDTLWNTVIPLEAECHDALGDVEAAVSCYQEIIRHDLDKESQGIHAGALRGLFNLWNKRDQHHNILDTIKSWAESDNEKRGVVYWMSNVAAMEDFHQWLIVAAQETGKQQLVTSVYAQAIGGYKTDGSWIVTCNLANLRYYQAVVMYYSDTSTANQDHAIDSMFSLIREMSDEDGQVYYPVYRAMQTISSWLLDKARQNGIDRRPPPKEATEYVKRLETFIETNLAALNMSDDVLYDPLLILARAKVLTGDVAEAKDILHDRMRDALDAWPEEEDADVRNRLGSISSTLMVFDDNEADVIASWKAMEPKRPAGRRMNGSVDSLNGKAREGNSDTEEVVVSNANIAEPGGPEAAAFSDETQNGEESALTAESDDISDQTAVSTNGEETNKETTTSLPKANLDGVPTNSFTYGCDGCDKDFMVPGDFYACRDCICVQMCSDCYVKFRAGTLRKFMCSSSHTHVYIPPFDRAAWDVREVGDIPVLKPKSSGKENGERIWGTMALQEWLNGLRQEWGLEQQTIDKKKEEEKIERFVARRIARRLTKAIREKKMRRVVEDAKAAKVNGAEKRVNGTGVEH